MQLIAISWPVVIIVGVILVALLIFIIARNIKDRKDLEHQLTEDYRKPKEAEHTGDPEDLKNN